MHEEWLPVPEYEGLYEVSSFGNFRRVAPARGAKLGKNLNGGTMSRGYRTITFCRRPGDQHTRKASRIVAEVFIGPPPTQGHQVNHKNGIRSDDRAENLEWVTPSENVRHRFDVLGLQNPRGEDHRHAKLTEKVVAEIKAARLNGASHGLIARHFGIPLNHIKAIATGRLWAHVQPSASSLTGRLAGRWG